MKKVTFVISDLLVWVAITTSVSSCVSVFRQPAGVKDVQKLQFNLYGEN